MFIAPVRAAIAEFCGDAPAAIDRCWPYCCWRLPQHLAAERRLAGRLIAERVVLVVRHRALTAEVVLRLVGEPSRGVALRVQIRALLDRRLGVSGCVAPEVEQLLTAALDRVPEPTFVPWFIFGHRALSSFCP